MKTMLDENLNYSNRAFRQCRHGHRPRIWTLQLLIVIHLAARPCIRTQDLKLSKIVIEKQTASRYHSKVPTRPLTLVQGLLL